MPWTILWEPRGLCIRMTGDLSCCDFLKSNRVIYDDPRFDTQMDYQIADLLGVDKVTVSGDEVREIARCDAMMSSRRPHVGIALVTDRDVLYGFSRMYQICTERSTWDTEIFDSLALAREWIERRLAASDRLKSPTA